ncbi:MAG: DUF805 domain-containing protein [Opitutales bacterium]|nr:DUF805 domain-containing protein [Opitutales bacterium]
MRLFSYLKEAWSDIFRNWGTFSGRMSRRNFWLTVPVLEACLLGIPALGEYLCPLGKEEIMHMPARELVLLWCGIFVLSYVSFALAILVWTHTVRRLHDAGFSGWWILLAGLEIPYVHTALLAVLIFLLAKKRDEKQREYGETIPASRGIKTAWILGALLFCALLTTAAIFEHEKRYEVITQDARS